MMIRTKGLKTVKTLLASLTLMVSASMAIAETKISLEDYARHAQFIDVKISPSGKYFAVSNRADDGNIRLIVLERNTLAIISQTHFRGQDTISGFSWANDERLLLTIAREIGSLEVPIPTGEIYAVNVDGKRGNTLTGFRSADRAATFSQIIDMLPNDEKHIVIASRNLRNREPFIEFYRLNVDTGRKRKVGQAPIRANRFAGINALTDNDGIPRLIIGLDPNKEADMVVMYRDGPNKDWREITRYSIDSDRSFLPLTFTADNNSLYALSDLETDTMAVVHYDIPNQKMETLVRHPLTNVSPLIEYKDGKAQDVIGARYEFDTIESVFFENSENSKIGTILENLTNVFPNRTVSLTSRTRDSNFIVVRVDSINMDTTYYLYDTKENKLGYLLNSRPWFKDVELPVTEVVTYKARDGQQILGLLTLPKNKPAEKLPLVLFPHGGPIGIRDSIAGYGPYEANIKVLAENGYAVFQPNYRGSGGFGLKFQQAAYQQWGTMMINDMTDGIRHLIEQGIVDESRICSFGASYGGYAAVQSAIREPELIKCAIAYVGVFDLHALYKDGDIREESLGVKFIERTVGRDAALLNAQSPIKNLDKLKAPVFIVHGAEDRRTPLSYATAFRAALEQRNHPFEWLVKEKEGHGFYNPENNVELWQRALAFLDQHIGKTTP